MATVPRKHTARLGALIVAALLLAYSIADGQRGPGPGHRGDRSRPFGPPPGPSNAADAEALGRNAKADNGDTFEANSSGGSEEDSGGRRTPPTDAQIEDLAPLFALERLLQMSPDELRQLRETIARIEAMTPEERQEALEKIQDFRQLDRTRRDELRRRFREMPPAERRALLRYWASLSPSEARQERRKLRQMKPEQRRAYREQIVQRYGAEKE